MTPPRLGERASCRWCVQSAMRIWCVVRPDYQHPHARMLVISSPRPRVARAPQVESFTEDEGTDGSFLSSGFGASHPLSFGCATMSVCPFHPPVTNYQCTRTRVRRSCGRLSRTTSAVLRSCSQACHLPSSVLQIEKACDHHSLT